MRDFLWHLVHSIVITRRVKMGDLPDFTKLLKSPREITIKMHYKDNQQHNSDGLGT